MKRLALSLLAGATALALLAPPSSALAGNANPRIAPPGSRPLGASYPEWAARWVQWAFGSPIETNPILNTDDCSLGDVGRVWFLSAAIEPGVSTNCSIPAGRSILLTPGGAFCSAATGDGTTEDVLRPCATALASSITDVSASLDGTPVQDPTSYLTVSPLFMMDLPADNLFGVPAGSYPTVVAGFFFVLRPLTPGTHVITAHDANFNGPGSEASFTYTITVSG